MDKTTKSEQARQELIDSPTVWFATLERARRCGNATLATQAEAELARLGVIVSFGTNGEANK